MHELSSLKANLPGYLASIGIEPHFIGEYKLTCRCPLHADKHPSFTASLKDGVWLWNCFPCGKGGTIIELHAQHTGLDTKQDFKRIVYELSALFNLPTSVSHTELRVRALSKASPQEPTFTEDDQAAFYKLTTPWRSTLYENPALQERVATSLGLSSATIRKCAMPCFDALGIIPAGFALNKKASIRSDRLAYIYERAYKVRSPFGDGREPRFWMHGSPRRPWRSFALTRRDLGIRIAHITEGETDCIALIDAGLENWKAAQPSHCIAIPGADGFKAEWGAMFAGVECHLWPDADKSGKTFIETTAHALHGFARKIMIRDPFYKQQAA